MPSANILPLALGLVIFSFLINSVLVVPFIDLLYKMNLTRRKEGVKGKITLFDKLHDKKLRSLIKNSRVKIVWNTGHDPHLEKPQKFLEIISDNI